MADADECVVVFAKLPVAGQVKTRLIGPTTAEQAAKLHRLCLTATLQASRAVGGAHVVLAVTPDGADFSGVAGGPVETLAQGEGDLGARLARVTTELFERGFSRVVVVGSDCPTMTAADVRAALELLRRFDLVIGPAEDGGYYLVGLARNRPALFEGIRWSSPRVAAQTRARAAGLGLTVAELPMRRDVDEWADVAALRTELPEGDARLAALRRFVNELTGGRRQAR